MAALSSSQVTQVYTEGGMQKLVVYQLKGVTTNDTYDTASTFKKVESAFWLKSSGSSTDGACSISTAVVTISPSSVSVDSGYLVCKGASA